MSPLLVHFDRTPGDAVDFVHVTLSFVELAGLAVNIRIGQPQIVPGGRLPRVRRLLVAAVHVFGSPGHLEGLVITLLPDKADGQSVVCRGKVIQIQGLPLQQSDTFPGAFFRLGESPLAGINFRQGELGQPHASAVFTVFRMVVKSRRLFECFFVLFLITVGFAKVVGRLVIVFPQAVFFEEPEHGRSVFDHFVV